jgi:hypothetical protein
MNHRESPHVSAGTRKALRCLSLLLVPALALEEGRAGPRLRNAMRSCAEPAPYLPILGAQPLRIEEAPPPPDLTSRPAAGAPPVPALSPTESAVAAANADAAHPVTSTTGETTTPAADATDKATDVAHVIAPPPAAPKTPPPILPDTTHPTVRPEDFLPYFQIPGTGHSAPDAPVPGTIPQSSATYIQSR